MEHETLKELIDDIEYFGCDPYYRDLWEQAIEEIRRRIEEKEIIERR